ncbi:uncharacterized protein LOC117119939 [Anneissia japonica]|uniref:uncharacterized protein LOC117119939 n=1 Tax=Anneissia japonica TaxID=1529436 RepID=UPI001425572C|nr:uncharacterized protein LOC117119939 [Anneissia japonica]
MQVLGAWCDDERSALCNTRLDDENRRLMVEKYRICLESVFLTIYGFGKNITKVGLQIREQTIVIQHDVCYVRKPSIFGNMGEAAVVSHMKGKKHHNLVSTGSSSSGGNANISDFFSASSTTSNKRCTKPDAAVGNTNTEKQQGTLTNAVCNKDDHWKAEILWSMKTVVDKYSYKSCENVSQVFQRMFPHSTIAKHFTCGERKCAYIVINS